MSLSCCFWEAHFACLSTQSNVYGLTSFRLPNGGSKVLVAPLKDNVLCLEYVKEKGILKPAAKEVQFIYSNPDDAELVSISAFTKQPESTGLVVGITFTKDDGSDSPSHYFNIFYPWEKDADFNLDSDSQGWTNIEHLLDFIPYYLCHTDIIQDEIRDTVFLLTGGDCKVHLYKEDKESSSRFSEHPIEDLFPELEDIPSIALWLHCQLLPGSRRLTAVGCQNGYVRCALVSCKADYTDVIKTWEVQHDSAVTCVTLFQTHTPVKRPSFLPSSDGTERNSHSPQEDGEWHLLVTSALEIAVVYRDVLRDGLQHQLVLPQSDEFDCTLCACVADVDWDAQNEILIGTYGQELLCYKYFRDNDTKPKKDELATANNDEETAQALGPDSRDNDNACREGEEPDQVKGRDCAEGGDECRGEYRLVWQRSFSHPLLAMQYVDLMSDGLYELILLSLKGVHIMQHDLEEAASICRERLATVHTSASSDARNYAKVKIGNQQQSLLSHMGKQTVPANKGNE